MTSNPKIPAAFYGRFSTDKQNEKSVDDQLRLCREYAAKNGYEIVAVYADRAYSGATFKTRPDIQRLLRDVREGRIGFRAVIAESTSRIGRDEEDRANVRKRFKFANVALVTPSDGVVIPMVDAIRATIDSQQLADLKVSVHRGMVGVIFENRNAGGRAYGYRPVRGYPGKPTIDAAEAEVVLRIFRCYAVDGDSPRAIARALNADDIAPPRGKFWRPATIQGNVRRRNGILRNQIYAGQIIWNRTQMVQDPDSEKRISRIRPEADWKRAEVPHLRIIPDDLWRLAQERLAARAGKGLRGKRGPKHMLHGLLRCGACGAGMASKGKDRKGRRIICSMVRETGRCSNRRGYYLDTIEQCVVDGLKEKLGTPAAIAHYLKVYNEERRRTSGDAIATHNQLTRDLVAAQLELDRLIDLTAKGVVTEAEATERLPQLRTSRDRLQAQLAAAAEPPRVIALHPTSIKRYLEDLDRLAGVIGDDLDHGDEGIARELRKLVESVTILPAPAGKPPQVRVRGRLESLLSASEFTGRSVGGKIGSGGAKDAFPTDGFIGFSFTRRAS